MPPFAIVVAAFIGAVGVLIVWARYRRHRLASDALAELIKNRPAKSAAAIDRLLDRIAPPIEDSAELVARGNRLATLAIDTAEGLQRAGVGSPYPQFALNTPSASADAFLRMIDVERELRVARNDAASIAGEALEDLSAPLFVEQILRVALEEPFKEAFDQPDVYSGARWAKAVCANGRRDYFLATMNVLDSSGDLAKHFADLCEVLFATGRRLPGTAAEQASYAALHDLSKS